MRKQSGKQSLDQTGGNGKREPKFQRMSIEQITIDPEDTLAEPSITKIQCKTIDHRRGEYLSEMRSSKAIVASSTSWNNQVSMDNLVSRPKWHKRKK